MTKEEIINDVFNRHEHRMADFPFNKELDATLEAMSEYAKNQSIEFLKWYIDKSIVFINYLSEIKPLVRSDEIEAKLQEFEGKTFEQLYSLYLQSKK